VELLQPGVVPRDSEVVLHGHKGHHVDEQAHTHFLSALRGASIVKALIHAPGVKL
jgi:hypothetical protein